MIPQPIDDGGSDTKVSVHQGIAFLYESRYFRVGLPLLLGMSLAVILSLLTGNVAWYILGAVVLVVPALVLAVHRPFVALVLWMLVYPFFASGSGGTSYWVLYRALIPAALGISILVQLLNPGEERSVRLGAAEWVMAAFIGLGLVSILLWNQVPAFTVVRFFDRFVVPFCAYGLIRLATPDERDLKLLVGVAFVIVIAQSSIALLTWYVPEVVPGRWLGPLQGARSVGTLRSPEAFSSILILCGLLLYHYAMNSRSKVLRLFAVATFGLSIVAVFFTFSRASWLGCLAVLFGLLWIYPKTTVRLLLILVLLAVLLGGTLLTGEVEYAVERLGTEETAEGRLVIHDALLQMIELKPASGWGYGNYYLYSPQFVRSIGDIPVRNRYGLVSHNSYLTIAAELGVPGLLLYLFPVGWWLVLTLKVRRRLPRSGFWSWRLVAVLWLAMIHMGITILFVDLITHNPVGTMLWWITLGLIANMISPLLPTAESTAQGWAPQTH